MSLSITPSDIIRNHPTNSSTSKQVHQFPKSPRFQSPNPEYIPTDIDAQMLFTLLIVNFPNERLDLVMEKNRISLNLSQ